jgi:transposase
MPAEYGSYKTAWRRLRRWVYGTIYLRPWPLRGVFQGYLLIVLLWRQGKGELVGYDGFKHRKGSKIHAVVDPSSMPLCFTVGLGNEHDSRRLQELVDGLSGRPRKLYADAAYDTEPIRSYLSSIGIGPNIPLNPRNGRKPRPYNVGLYKRMRSAVERFFGWLKSFI